MLPIWDAELIMPHLPPKHCSSFLFPQYATSLITQYLSPGSFHGLCGSLPHWGASRWLSRNESACKAGNYRRQRLKFDPWVRKIPSESHGNSLQYSCLENTMGRGAWRATVHGVAKNQTQQKRLSTHAPYLRERSEFCISGPSVVLTICSVNAEIRVTSWPKPAT